MLASGSRGLSESEVTEAEERATMHVADRSEFLHSAAPSRLEAEPQQLIERSFPFDSLRAIKVEHRNASRRGNFARSAAAAPPRVARGRLCSLHVRRNK
jgi:hypothetical protein